MSDSHAPVGPATDRRSFLRCSACGLVGLAALTLPGCGGEAGAPTNPVKGTPTDSTRTPTDTTKTTGTKGQKFEVVGNQVRVFLANVTELATPPAVFLIEPAQMLVVRTSGQNYSALSAVCTHEGCTVSGFSGNQLVCPCHGSRFDLAGAVLVGPAVGALPRLSTSFDSVKNELLIDKGS